MGSLTLRLGWRLASRHKLRTAVLCLAIALPVAVGTALAAVADTAVMTQEEARAAVFGTAEGQIRASSALDIAKVVPAGTTTAADLDLAGLPLISAAGRRVDATGRALDLANPLTKGVYLIRAGHPRSDPGTIVLSTELATQLQVKPGDTLAVGSSSQSHVTVAALAADRFDTHKVFFTTPTSRDAHLATTVGSPRWFVAGPVDESALRSANATFTPRSAADSLAGASPLVQGPAVLIGLGILAETMLLVAAALTVVVRSQRRHVALLAAVGVRGRAKVDFFGMYAFVVSAAGTAAGIAAGLTAARAAQPALQAGAGADWGSFSPAWPTVALLTLLTVAAVVATVAIPARRMLRTPVTELLRETPPATTRRARRLAVAAGLCVAGVALVAAAGAASDLAPLVAFLGLCTGLTGTVLLVMAVASRVTHAGYLGGPAALRVAVRQAMAFSGRTAITVMALAAIAGVAATVQVTTASVMAKQAQGYVPVLPKGRALAVVRRTLTPVELEVAGSAARFQPAGIIDADGRVPVFVITDFMDCLRQRRLLRSGGTNNWQPCYHISKSTIPFRPVGIASATDVQKLTGVPWPASVTAGYNNGDTAALADPAGVNGDSARIASRDFVNGSIEYRPVADLPVYRAPIDRGQYSALPAVFVSPATAGKLHLAQVDADSYVFRGDDPDRIRRALPADVQADAKILIEQGSSANAVASEIIRVVTLAVTVTIALIVVAMMGLWAADLRNDHAMLAAVGARTRWVRLTSATLASLLAATGVLAGSTWGVMTGWLFLNGMGTRPVLSIAPAGVAAAGVAVAAVVGLIAVSRRAKPARRA